VLLDVLRKFDGRPRVEVAAELANDGIKIGHDLLRRLVDLGVLAEAQPGSPSRVT
jgi:hypothetical protein